MPDFLAIAGAAFTSLDASGIQIIGLGILSFVVSILAGMTGAALGIIQLPVMLAMGFDPLVAAGTNLGIIFLGSTSGLIPHLRAGRVVPKMVILFGAPTVVGTFFGAFLANRVPTWTLLVVIAAILAVLTGITYVEAWKRTHPILRPVRHRPWPKPSDPTGVRFLNARKLTVDGTLSAGIGAIGGAAGMTLGALRLPILISFLKMDPWYATGTNAAISLLTAIAGFAGHAAHGNFDLLLLAVLGVAAMAGSLIGANLTGRVKPNILRFVIAAALTGIIPLVVFRATVAYPT
ncbi:MAG: sulfite exporter TauE/SafE family protein [Chloroflexi bacterium]|nr:sulfite exporter TauE/SafE family protein [Chloroflexota bacterium]